MKKNAKGQDLVKQTDRSSDGNTSTRRGFLFSLLGGFAGAAGLTSIAGRAKTSLRAISGAEPVKTPQSSKPIDNIFVPLSPKKNLKRRGQ
jgi:hypothetical protein